MRRDVSLFCRTTQALSPEPCLTAGTLILSLMAHRCIELFQEMKYVPCPNAQENKNCRYTSLCKNVQTTQLRAEGSRKLDFPCSCSSWLFIELSVQLLLRETMELHLGLHVQALQVTDCSTRHLSLPVNEVHARVVPITRLTL